VPIASGGERPALITEVDDANGLCSVRELVAKMAAIPKTVGPVSDWREHTPLLRTGRSPLAVAGHRFDSFLSLGERSMFRSGRGRKHGLVNEWNKKWTAEQDRSAPQMQLEGGF
jgi:hypothetical protein